MKTSILLIEDEKLMRVTLGDALKSAGYDVLSFDTGTEALKVLKSHSFDIAVTDVRLPDIDGFDILREILRSTDSQVIVMTAFGTIKDAVEAMKLGAFDYITKPFALDEFLLLIERATEVRKLREENVRLRRDINRCYSFPSIIGESEGIKRIFSLIEKVSESDATVLILGESGTGKELVASTIHYQGRRKEKPLIKVNCAALPEGLIESELFGHEKGAFTGAIKKKPGRFELANEGTVFLDEVGDLPLPTQAKILRVIQEREFERVGGTATVAVDVRLIAATNKDLAEEVKKGRFREDLYYRLNVIPIPIPPLRERKEDIPRLIEFFLEKYRSKLLKNVRFSKDAVDTLLAYDYPGNVRELESIIERCVTLSASNEIGRSELPSSITGWKSSEKKLSLSDVAADAEKNHIVGVLKSTQGNKTKAAGILGISRKTLWEKMNAYGIE
ncbi:MAG: sigma-54 dependent transcriptional regulator [Deltaproteobacteria bacterium]|nr:sigma-54 dependent transcriptional regulator [Deltaproteobacteria bacterium]